MQPGRAWLVRPSIYFLATALPDTAEAVPGAERDAQEESGAASRPIYGQVVRPGRLGGGVPPEVARALRTGSGEVVVVPWGHGEDCRTTRWRSSARWLQPGSTALFMGGLRDPRQWAGGRPTFDLLAWLDAYPTAPGFADADSALTAEELFDLFAVLPTGEQVLDVPDPYPAIAPLFRWATDHPDLARRFPATEALQAAHETASPCVTADALSPVAGTYRLTVSVPGESPGSVYFRTSAHRFRPECPGSAPARDPGKFSPRQAESYLLYVHAATHPDSIPQENAVAWEAPGCAGVSSVEVWDAGGTDESRVRSWEADLDVEILLNCLGTSPGLRRGSEALTAALRAGADVERGVFRWLDDGRVTFEETLRLDGRELWRVRAERISPQVLAY